MFTALPDFLIYCRVERRLSDLTCRAYVRDVRTCLQLLRGQALGVHPTLAVLEKNLLSLQGS